MPNSLPCFQFFGVRDIPTCFPKLRRPIYPHGDCPHQVEIPAPAIIPAEQLQRDRFPPFQPNPQHDDDVPTSAGSIVANPAGHDPADVQRRKNRA